jgi:hypothetical protein
MAIESSTSSDEALRNRAVKRLKKQADFRVHLLMYLSVNTFLVAIWAITGAEFFWPMFPIVGWGIGVVANAWDAYSTDVPSERSIEREMSRLRQQ